MKGRVRGYMHGDGRQPGCYAEGQGLAAIKLQQENESKRWHGLNPSEAQRRTPGDLERLPCAHKGA